MEYANAEIRLAGSRDNTVIREVSASEIPLLKAIHGDDSVINIKPSRTEDINLKAERERLAYAYNKELVEKLYPGVLGKIPATLAEVGIEVPEEAPVVARSVKGKN